MNAASSALASIRDRNNRVWLYKAADARIVGFGSLGITRRRWPSAQDGFQNLVLLPKMSVAKEFHGMGFGTAILSDLISKAQEFDLPIMTLEVQLENAAAIALYRKVGFVESSHRRTVTCAAATITLIVMYLNLT